MAFSDLRYLVTFPRYSPSLRKVFRNRAEILTLVAKFLGKGPPKFLTYIFKHGPPSNTWQSLVTISQGASEIRRWRKRRGTFGPKSKK